jgi:hypothetical protein
LLQFARFHVLLESAGTVAPSTLPGAAGHHPLKSREAVNESRSEGSESGLADVHCFARINSQTAAGGNVHIEMSG